MFTPAFCLLVSLISLLFPPQEATIVFAGDAMQHQSQLDAACRADGTYNYSETFADISPWVKKADYAVVNLETTLADKGFTGYPCFCSPRQYATALRDAGFDLFLTANNHTLDRRDAGLRRTLSVLDSLKVDHIGTYASPSYRAQTLPLIKDIKGFKVAFLNYTYGTNGITEQGNVVVDRLDKKKIAADIAAARKSGAELVIVMPHWGDEYHLEHNAAQKDMAKFMQKAGADIIIGGHPHVVQPMQMHRDSLGHFRPVIYSLGNFVSGMRTTDTRGGAMVQLKLHRDSLGKACVADACYRLVYTIPGVDHQKSHRLVFIDTDTDINKTVPGMAAHCKAFVNNATKTFDRHNVNVPRYQANK